MQFFAHNKLHLIFFTLVCVGILAWTTSLSERIFAQGATCHLLTPGSQVPEGFGVPWHVVGSQENLISATCQQNGAQIIFGNGSQIQYIYQETYEWAGSSWQQRTLSGTRAQSSPWLIGNGSVALQKSPTELAAVNYIVGYICSWDAAGNRWKCGCRDQTCATNHWQLQAYRADAQTTQTNTGASTGANTGANTTTNTTGTQTTTNTTGTTGGTTGSGTRIENLNFRKVVVDSSAPRNAHTKALADINGDGKLDAVVGSAAGDGIYWYEWPSWTKRKVQANGTFTTDMQVGDIDNDGDIDLIIPKGQNIGRDVFWYENRSNGTQWVEHSMGAAGAHDVEVGDLNGDGLLDVVTRMNNATVFLNNNKGASWQKVSVTQAGQEGTIIGDFDADGDKDLAFGGNGLRWCENTNGSGTNWSCKTIEGGMWPTMTGMAAGDVNGDGKEDIGITCSETANCTMVWYMQPSWEKKTITSGVSYVHTFKFVDIDNDGDKDAVWGEMHQSSQDRVAVSLNKDGRGGSWETKVVDTSGVHNLRVGDIGSDGDLDIFGANWNTSAPDKNAVKVWENISDRVSGGTTGSTNTTGTQTTTNTTGTTGGTTGGGRLSLTSWQRHVIDNARPNRAVFIEAGDVNGDNRLDILTGGWWYQNPGALAGSWQRSAFGGALRNLALSHDFDGDGDLDVLGTNGVPGGNAFVWAKNSGNGQFSIQSGVESGRGDFLQGVALVRLGGSLRVALSWHNGGGNALGGLVVPQGGNGTWSHSTLSGTQAAEDLSVGDIDKDGDEDLLLGTKWLENTGSGFSSHTLSSSPGLPDRNELADINGDGRLDAVVGFEAISKVGKLAWYEQGASAGGAWQERLLPSVVGPMSVDAADMDNDGDIDVVVGEHNQNVGAASLWIMENADGRGGSWNKHKVYQGDEHHDGAQLVDIDKDGDLDIISIGWFHDRVVLYENKAR